MFHAAAVRQVPVGSAAFVRGYDIHNEAIRTLFAQQPHRLLELDLMDEGASNEHAQALPAWASKATSARPHALAYTARRLRVPAAIPMSDKHLRPVRWVSVYPAFRSGRPRAHLPASLPRSR